MSQSTPSKAQSGKAFSAKTSKPKKSLAPETDLIPERYQDLAAVLFLLILALAFFAPVVFQGKTFVVPDNTASLAMRTFVEDAKAQGVQPQWTPYIFSGMPSLGSLFVQGDRWYDLVYAIVWKGVLKVLAAPLPNPEGSSLAFFYFLYGAGVYWLLRLKECSPFQALVGAVGALLTTISVVWITVGHNTKIVSAACYPYLLVFAERLRRSENWKSLSLNVALLSCVLSMLFGATHVQMIYYGGLFVAICLLVELLYALVKKEPLAPWLRSAGGFAVAALLAAAMYADTYLAVAEYSPYSIRGSASVTTLYPELASEKQPPQNKADAKGGLSYDYATSWSFGVEEVLTFFVPSYFGYGNASYWGPQPFTACPQFFGATILVLALIGAVYWRRDRFVQALCIVGAFSLLVSFGKHFPLLYDLLFYFAPFFNKFRAPSMILILLALSACALAGYGLKAIGDLRENASEEAKSMFRKFAYASVAVALVGILGFSGCKQSYVEQIARSDRGKELVAQYRNPAVIQAYESQFKIFEMAKSDMTISLLMLGALMTLAHFFIERKLPKNAFRGALMAMVVIDFWRADAQLMQGAQPKREEKKVFEKPDYVAFLEKDSTKFRILPLLRDNDANWHAYFRLESVGGYQGAKMRIYQDLIELFGSGNAETPTFFTNPVLMDLLNLKYVIVDKPTSLEGFKTAFEGSRIVFERENPTPRAWLVKSVEKASVPEILNHIRNQDFNPREKAFVEQDAPKIDAPDSLASVALKSAGIHHLDFIVKASGDNFLFVSEIFYDKGWKCLIDGQETPIYKTNYAFRGVVVPKGTREVKFIYESQAFNVGRVLAIVANALVALALVTSGAMAWRERQTN
ncbi:MAG: YfhO family protein [Chloroherpetonaceae bacterium]|nr:YfhO family protein [Chloroherpetonaceae bacterium]MDW8437404.1 YfhO family protein [Chloroherpetonaceae bacterium]